MSMEMKERHQELTFGSGFWAKKTKLEKILIVACGILAIVVIGLIIGLAVNSNKKSSESESKSSSGGGSGGGGGGAGGGGGGGGKNYDICKTKQCVDTANYLLAAIDSYKNPCDDFYKYACGRWDMTHHIPKSKDSISTFDNLIDTTTARIKYIVNDSRSDYSSTMKEAVKFYKKCLNTDKMNNDGLKPLLDAMTAIFSSKWPMIDPMWDPTAVMDAKLNFLQPAIIANMMKYGLASLFEVMVQVDPHNSTKYAIGVDQMRNSGFGLRRGDLINRTASERVKKVNAAYIEYIQQLVNSTEVIANETATLEDINDAVDFESSLAKIIVPEEERYDILNLYKITTVGELSETLKIGDFLLEVLQELIEPHGVEVTNSTEIYAPGEPYFKKLVPLLQSTNIRTIMNYLNTVFMRKYASTTTDAFRKAEFELESKLTGVKALPPREDSCSPLSNIIFEYATAGQYAAEFFPLTAKTELQVMMKSIITAFKARLLKIEWMDIVTKNRAIEKANEVLSIIAYPNWALNSTIVDNFYEPLLGKLKAGQPFLDDIMIYTKFKVDDEFNRLKQTPNRDSWDSIESMTPLTTNAFYDPTGNNIRILAGILGGRFYEHGRLPVINYGAIGIVMGHELHHGFDNQGRQFDGEGNLKQWWEKATLKAYINRTNCFVNQYGSITDPQVNIPLNGKRTLGENIADNGGVRQSFAAYKKSASSQSKEVRLAGMEHFTSDQLFFLSYANSGCAVKNNESLRGQIQEDVHSPSNYRINVPLSNFDEFSKAFKCEKGSAMNPDHKCIVW